MRRAPPSRPTVALRVRALLVVLAALFATVSSPSSAQRYREIAADTEGSVRAPSHASKTAEAYATAGVRTGHAEQPRPHRHHVPAHALPPEARAYVANGFVGWSPASLRRGPDPVTAKTHAELMVFLN